jgi:NAD+ kinase
MKAVSTPVPLRSVGLVVNPERDDAIACADQVRSWAASHAITVGEATSVCDLVVSIGGDGTVLRAVQLIDGAPVPVLGVNCGTLGYLTSIEPEDTLAVLDQLRAGRLPEGSCIEERMLLDVQVDTAEGGRHTLRALNEMVVEKVESGHTVRLEVRIEGRHFATYSADGLIVATPTGSTAYSLSARGPVVSPTHRAMILTPVSPHMLFDRALVLDPQETVTITVRGHRDVSLAIDGLQFVDLHEGDTVRVTADGRVARFLHVGERGFHQILREKFGLGSD